jgi:hypothetical protein
MDGLVVRWFAAKFLGTNVSVYERFHVYITLPRSALRSEL